MSSPAQRYAAFRARQELHTLTEFESRLPFGLDPFQQEACSAVAKGHSVLVAAPTGAGKTVVGEYAVFDAHQRGLKSFYTTPIKALSNQKFNDLRKAYGDDAVGLLTGDTSINSNADIVVMTTEVLRNMIYAGSQTLDRLGVVVLDEVHYLADRFRGSVWEEVIVHAAESTALICLSATVSNAEEFGAWLTEVRGDTTVIVSEERPVPLWPHVLVREGIFDLYAPHVDPANPGPQPALNPELESIARRQRHADAARGPRGRHRPRAAGRRAPPRFAVVDVLDRNALLPVIVFIFSRAGCEDAVDQVRSAGIALTTEQERSRITQIVEQRCAGIAAADLAALGYLHWKDHLEAGIAAHHAGMLPLFKEVVEELFVAGLIKVVYATETLALGINMPARSVVLEKLVKWDGQAHQDLTAGEYTQLTGRAGRRGIDVEGHGVVVEHPGFDVAQLGRLASRRTYPLVSSFQPTYNMAVNLVDNVGISAAREVLELSFAQYQADQSVVGKAQRAREFDRDLAGFREAATCDRGDFMEYAKLRDAIGRAQKNASKEASRARREASVALLSGLRRGDVVRIGGGRRTGLAVVVESDSSLEAPRPVVVSDKARSFRLSAADLPAGIEVVGAIKVPKNSDPRQAARRRELAQAIDAARHGFSRTAKGGSERTPTDAVDALTKQMRQHPCHACPDREEHARWAERYFRTMRDKDALMGQISRATGSIARIFDRRCAVLRELGYLEGEDQDVTVNDTGRMLRVIFAENDLTVAECLRRGVWQGLTPPALAAVVSMLLYSGRRDDEARPARIPGGPNGVLGRVMTRSQQIWNDIDDLHKAHQLPAHPQPHVGMVAPIHAWAQGKSLDVVLKASDIAPGDMVRWIKQVIDALDQVSQVAPQDDVRAAARHAIVAMRRGVVAY